MPITKYSYQKTPVDIARLKQEIENSTIVIALSHIEYADPNLDIYFKDVLSATDKTTLDSIVTNHTGQPLLVDVDIVKVFQEQPDKITNGHYRGQGLSLSISATTGLQTFDFVFPIPISILSATVMPQSSMIGDKVNVLIAPDTMVGTITADVTAGSNVLTVSSTVLDNIDLGILIKIDDGTNSESLGQVIDISGSDITVENSTTNAYATGSAVKITWQVLKDFVISTTYPIVIGETSLSSLYLPSNTVLRIVYDNISGTAKDLSVLLEYFY